MTNQLYVFLRHNEDIKWPWHYEAELKEGLSNGEFLSKKTAWGESPDKALQNLALEDCEFITFVREGLDYETKTVVVE